VESATTRMRNFCNSFVKKPIVPSNTSAGIALFPANMTSLTSLDTDANIAKEKDSNEVLLPSTKESLRKNGTKNTINTPYTETEEDCYEYLVTPEGRVWSPNDLNPALMVTIGPEEYNDTFSGVWDTEYRQMLIDRFAPKCYCFSCKKKRILGTTT